MVGGRGKGGGGGGGRAFSSLAVTSQAVYINGYVKRVIFSGVSVFLNHLWPLETHKRLVSSRSNTKTEKDCLECPAFFLVKGQICFTLF